MQALPALAVREGSFSPVDRSFGFRICARDQWHDNGSFGFEQMARIPVFR
jgi:hypothetical protein